VPSSTARAPPERPSTITTSLLPRPYPPLARSSGGILVLGWEALATPLHRRERLAGPQPSAHVVFRESPPVHRRGRGPPACTRGPLSSASSREARVVGLRREFSTGGFQMGVSWGAPDGDPHRASSSPDRRGAPSRPRGVGPRRDWSRVLEGHRREENRRPPPTKYPSSKAPPLAGAACPPRSLRPARSRGADGPWGFARLLASKDVPRAHTVSTWRMIASRAPFPAVTVWSRPKNGSSTNAKPPQRCLPSSSRAGVLPSPPPPPPPSTMGRPRASCRTPDQAHFPRRGSSSSRFGHTPRGLFSARARPPPRAHLPS